MNEPTLRHRGSSTGRSFNPPEDTGWRYASDRMLKLIDTGAVLFPTKGDGRPREKKFRADLQTEFVAFPSIIDDVFTADGTAQIRSLFNEDIFDFSKPSTLLQRLVKQSSDEESIILDIFAGSGTTAQAVLEQNLADGGNRRFILVQLPEPTDRKDYTTIASITKERVRRVSKKLATEQAGKLQLEAAPDLGFRVYKLAESNFKPWNAKVSDAKALGEQMQLHVHHVLEGRTEQDLFAEILLKSGFMLTASVLVVELGEREPATRNTSTRNALTAYDVNHGELLVCLAQPLTHAALKAMAARKPQRAVCLDAGFTDNDQLKANAVQLFKGKGVVFKTV